VSVSVYRARWILPVSGPPIEGGWVAVEHGRVLAVGDTRSSVPAKPLDLGDVAILPALVNAHTHLELSNLTAPIGKPGTKLHDWIGEVVRTRRAGGGLTGNATVDAVRLGVQLSYESGVGLLADIAQPPLPEFDSPSSPPVDIVSMAEVLGLVTTRSDEKLKHAREHLAKWNQNLSESDRQGLRLAPSAHGFRIGSHHPFITPGISPHAPYSTPFPVIERCVEIAISANATLAMHVAESPEERVLLESGDGPFADCLKAIQVYSPTLFPWGKSATLDLLKRLSKSPRVLVVHGNDLREQEMDLLAMHSHMTVVYCPRTHDFFKHDRHPVTDLLARNIRVAIGTDSLASNPDLSLWKEIQWLLRHRQDIDWQTVLAMGTLHGATALGRNDLGRIAVGAEARLLALPVESTNIDSIPQSMLDHDPIWL
jgi:cytosine/adenosine deaminase-related metal-dependent hydrolase